jgi:hypothetical protein
VQLERIRASIQDLIYLEDLEPLRHFRFPPWNKVTPYTIDISPLPKDEAALVMIFFRRDVLSSRDILPDEKFSEEQILSLGD